MTGPMNHIGQILVHHKTQANGGRRHTNIQTTSPTLDQRAGAIDIVREEIAGVFRDKLGVSMVLGGSHIGNRMIADLTITHIHRGPEYQNSQNFRVTKKRARVST
jgi:hypothetical protein